MRYNRHHPIGLKKVKKENIDLVLIGGMPRSGTTLLARTLAEHFKIPFSPETHYFTYAYRNGRLAPEYLPREAIEEPRVAAAYMKIVGQSRSVETFRMLLGSILGDARVVGEKTPAHLLAFSEILQQDDDAICIVILRDFFEITESLRKVPWNTSTFPTNLKRCVGYHRVAHRTQRSFPERVIALDYKMLCKNEKGLLDALANRLPRGTCEAKQRLFDPKLEPWKRDALRAPEARHRKVPRNRRVEWLFARFAQSACNFLWPIALVKV